MLLEKINSPNDLKKLSIEELNTIANEVHYALLNKTSVKGGHTGPNFGVIEMTIALHYVFESPKDKIIFDISHQSYVHKMLTGRANSFLYESKFDEISGYTNQNESEHDLFTIGHTSTSISLAAGVAKARDIKNEKYNVIAVIGDGSLSGGLAYEGLNQIATEGTNSIIIINDNDQSIASNPKGGIYNALRNLRESDGRSSDNIFVSLGYEYHYLNDGNNLEKLIDLFDKVKDNDKPVVLHIKTKKGNGVKYMEDNPESYHAGGPYNIETGEYLHKDSTDETYDQLTTKVIIDKINKNPDIVVVNAGTPMVIFSQEQRKIIGKQFVDVGIAESNAATMITGLAKNGANPIWTVYSTFMQRTYDQLSHDIALNNQPVTILVYLASINGMNDETHLGFFDIPFLAHIPNFVYLAPTCKEEHIAMLNWAIEQKEHPVAIRVPVGKLKETGIKDETDYNNLNKNLVTEKGKEVAIFGLGNFYSIAEEVSKELKKSTDITPTIINPKFITGLDNELLDELSKTHKLFITIEDGVIEGGYGQMIASYIGGKDVKIKNYGISKHFHDRYNTDELMKANNITVNDIVKYIVNNL